MDEFLAHWAQCNAALPPTTPLLVRLPETNTTVTRAQFQNRMEERIPRTLGAPCAP